MSDAGDDLKKRLDAHKQMRDEWQRSVLDPLFDRFCRDELQIDPPPREWLWDHNACDTVLTESIILPPS